MQLDPSAFVADPELVQELEKSSIPIPCEADRVLFCQGDAPVGVYIVHEGEATLSMNSDEGKPLVSVQTTAGSLLGLPGLIGNHPYSLTAIARTGAKVSFVSRDHFTTLMHSNPLLSLKVLQVLAAEVRTARIALTHM